MLSYPLARFMSKIEKQDNDCWEWLGSTDRHGYGQVKVGQKMCRAHRVSFELMVSEIPTGMYILHHCDNRRCVNPDHLFLGTQLDNIRDMRSKGREKDVRGETNGQSRLTQEQVVKILELVRQGKKQTEVAKMYLVATSTINAIVTATNWKWIPRPQED